MLVCVRNNLNKVKFNNAKLLKLAEIMENNMLALSFLYDNYQLKQ